MNPHIIRARNVDHALHEGLTWLSVAGIKNDSRNGPVSVAPGPVLTVYEKPQERVLLSPLRDANPFFHLYECVWMLAGCNDAATVSKFAKNMDMFANEEGIMWGAYGWRWREFFGFDQLTHIIKLLRKDPKTRRAVLTMWAPNGDLANTDVGGNEGVYASKDVPCNTHVYFDATTGVLNMTVCNRSNDAVWGAYGANAVHMSFLQEFIATALGVPLGQYAQFSNNFHVYTERADVRRLLDESGVHYAPTLHYEDHDGVSAVSLGFAGDFDASVFLEECEAAAEDPYSLKGCWDAWLNTVFRPMMWAHAAYKEGNYGQAYKYMACCAASDWQRAGVEWLLRREAAATAKAPEAGQ